MKNALKIGSYCTNVKFQFRLIEKCFSIDLIMFMSLYFVIEFKSLLNFSYNKKLSDRKYVPFNF